MAQCVGTDRVLLNQPVCVIDQTDSEIVTVRTINGKEFKAKTLILAAPVAVQQKIHYLPGLPPLRNQLVQRAPQGSVFKCIVYYDKMFWRERNMCGSMLLLGDDYEVPLNYALDDTKPDGSKPAIVGLVWSIFDWTPLLTLPLQIHSCR